MRECDLLSIVWGMICAISVMRVWHSLRGLQDDVGADSQRDGAVSGVPTVVLVRRHLPDLPATVLVFAAWITLRQTDETVGRFLCVRAMLSSSLPPCLSLCLSLSLSCCMRTQWRGSGAAHAGVYGHPHQPDALA